MAGLGLAGGVVILAVATMTLPGAAVAAGVRAEPALAADPDEPGSRLPPAGRSLFDELFEADPPDSGHEAKRHAIPFPFERLLATLDARVAPGRVKTALIPLGRSLQRFAADPDYFASPRLVVAVDADDATPIDQPYLKDRLYLGYQPAAATIEVISYNESAGRFEFQVVKDYDADQRPHVEYAERAICVACHQGHAPIFSDALWGETNANTEVADKLAGLGETFHGVPVRQGIDDPDAFDLATDRANRIAAAQMLWNQGCGAGETGMRRRAAVLLAALRFRLGGARPAWRPSPGDKLRAGLHGRLTTLWPDGLFTPVPDLPNRNPLIELAAGAEPMTAIEPSGQFDPTVPRAPISVWRMSRDEAESFGAFAREIGTFFSARDIAWLDGRLATLAPEAGQVHSGACRTRRIDLKGGLEELRINCGAGEDKLSLDGYLRRRGSEILDGKLRSLTVGVHATIRLLRVAGGTAIAEARGERLRLQLREGAAGLGARLATGERLSALTLHIDRSGGADAEIAVLDDLSPLREALRRVVGSDSEGHPLGPGPLRRRALLAALAAQLGGT